MANHAGYILKAHGAIEPAWLQDCLQLFKERQVCIRKLLLLQDGQPTCFSMLELHFVLPQTTGPSPDPAHSFLSALAAQLEQQTSATPSLTAI